MEPVFIQCLDFCSGNIYKAIFGQHQGYWPKGRSFKVVLKVCLTDLLILGDAHDPEGLQGLREQILVLLPGNGDVPVGEEAVVVVIFKEEFI